MLNQNGLTKDNYKVTSFSVFPNTTWQNGVSTVNGQIASQSFEIALPEIKADGSNIGKLIDELAQINNIVLNGLNFDVSDKTSYFHEAREKAFKNAKAKAYDYTNALFLTLGKVVNVKDFVSEAPVVNDDIKM